MNPLLDESTAPLLDVFVRWINAIIGAVREEELIKNADSSFVVSCVADRVLLCKSSSPIQKAQPRNPNRSEIKLAGQLLEKGAE